MARELNSINDKFRCTAYHLYEIESSECFLQNLDYIMQRYLSRPEGLETLPESYYADLFTMISDYLVSDHSNISKTFFRCDLFKILTFCYLFTTRNNIFLEAIYRPTFQEVFKKLCSRDKWVFNRFAESYQLLWYYFEGLNMHKNADYKWYRSDIFSPPPLTFNDLQIFEKNVLLDHLVDKNYFDTMDVRFLFKTTTPSLENVSSEKRYSTLESLLIERLSIQEIKSLYLRWEIETGLNTFNNLIRF